MRTRRQRKRRASTCGYFQPFLMSASYFQSPVQQQRQRQAKLLFVPACVCVCVCERELKLLKIASASASAASVGYLEKLVRFCCYVSRGYFCALFSLSLCLCLCSFSFIFSVFCKIIIIDALLQFRFGPLLVPPKRAKGNRNCVLMALASLLVGQLERVFGCVVMAQGMRRVSFHASSQAQEVDH